MIKNFLDSDVEPENDDRQSAADPGFLGLSEPNTIVDPETGGEELFVLSRQPEESLAETARKSGLAMTMGIVFFGSVVFMLILGWFADLLFGSSPWGIVGGIVLGSIIGFVQFFRISSQIFNPNEKVNTGRMLMPDDNDKK
ncbi:MAG: AtpZ/AtpI family protein [Blastocatellia bacterium]